LNTIEEAIDEIKNGKVIIVVDDEDRENEAILSALQRPLLRNCKLYGYARRGLNMCAAY
jgi:3,4-dihydroxy-2-butanone 4-phosphate synthase